MLCRHRLAAVSTWALLLLISTAPTRAQEGAVGEDPVVTMDAFNVTAYGGRIKIVDGFTGKEYRGDNPLVFDFAASFNTLLIGFHKRLVLDEVKHMRFRLELGSRFEKEVNALAEGFGIRPFALDRSTWLSRERAIVTRLIKEPFFRIEALVVWDLDKLNATAPEKPRNKYAADIRFNAGTSRWERRILTEWPVTFVRNPNHVNGTFRTYKEQGLNLDTMAGFHFVEVGLPGDVPPHAFRDVKLTYPIFFSDTNTDGQALRTLQEQFVAHLFFLYDPFSWVARRDTRFRGGFVREIREHLEAQRFPVSDREMLSGVLAQYLSDVVTIKTQGADEIYALQMLQKRLGESPHWLGVKLDLLNWGPREKREARDAPEEVLRLPVGSPRGFRHVMIDAYQRFGDEMTVQIQARLVEAKGRGGEVAGMAILREVVAGLSGLTYEEFARRAVREQEERLTRHRLTKPEDAGGR